MSLFGDQFQRWWRISLGDLSFTSETAHTLTARFKIELDKGLTANNCELRVFNLTREHREELERADAVTAQVEAGYADGTQAVIFLGVLNEIDTERVGPDWVLRATAADGEAELLNARVQKTFPAGTQYSQVLADLVDALGIDSGNVSTLQFLSTKNGDLALEHAYTASGSAANELRWFTKSVGVEWSIQQGAFKGSLSGFPADVGGPLITPETGLIGVPKVNAKDEVQGRALLLPDMQPNTAFILQSDKITGNYVANKVTYIGDTTGQEWFTDFEGIPQ